MQGNILITGVSSGIGRAIAAEMVRHDFAVFGTVRREADAGRVRQEMGSRFTPLVMDVTDQASVDAARDRLSALLAGTPLNGLVNNAGIAVLGPLLYLPLEELRYQMEVNVIGLVRVTQAFFPLLGPNARGRSARIINISSVSGRFALPFAGPYAASKHALEAISDALRRELLLREVDVIVVEPGRVKTPIWDKVRLTAARGTEYNGVLSKVEEMLRQRMESALPPQAVARVVRLALTVCRPRSRYIIPNGWISGWILPCYLPDRWLDRLLARQFGLMG
ncbi:MAG: SDR family NAD(P)-dependent oxidoreductase, partial [Kiritimatiellia bacterium]